MITKQSEKSIEPGIEKIGRSGWKSIINLGGIDRARAMEAILLIWFALSKKYDFEPLNFRVVK